ncbi:cysteinyl-tRNA synthetase [Scopulibacillus darangshiensis]|uniref:Cysteine--tRNA ligase n=1 Tax=Scopulibacillus darangshiensis TaxID=442528 RepID=A0A4R2NR14_9BACL|nr:cysteine--tRNA ligase [Scopulibacillus darangshiensis]TCP24142.1 cysteinyl-tRNA synthetase [Scopulibacillus darangshiensis]
MAIQVYNTLNRKKEPFKTIEENKVKMYVCGPTVYNYIHIGNARPAVVFDTIRRYLEYRGYDVLYVSNFTDVDDRLIKASIEQGDSVLNIAERFINAYKEDVNALNVREADLHPRATETMPEIIAFIQKLIDKGYAYEAGGDVYFRTRKFQGYGKLSHQSIDELKVGARIDVGEHKEDPLDFTLWKAAKPGEITWESPWGVGRPGWHIECSAMVEKYLGDTIDIHAGGQDLTFPHHENEIAQSEALHDDMMANYWLHNGYIKINNEKMSKSIGNVILVHELVKKYDPNVVRFFIQTVHYRHPINFNDELLSSAEQAYDRLRTTYYNLLHRLQHSADLLETDERNAWMETIKGLKDRFIAEMDDDFNTANGISVLFDASREANKLLQDKNSSKEILEAYLALLDELTGVLGLSLAKQEELLDEDIENLISQREDARKTRRFDVADQIRDDLKDKGIVLEDTPQGVRWKRV